MGHRSRRRNARLPPRQASFLNTGAPKEAERAYVESQWESKGSVFTYGYGALLGLAGAISGVVELTDGGHTRSGVLLIALGAVMFGIDSWAVYDRVRERREPGEPEGAGASPARASISLAGVACAVVAASAVLAGLIALGFGVLASAAVAVAVVFGVAYVLWPRLAARLRVHF